MLIKIAKIALTELEGLGKKLFGEDKDYGNPYAFSNQRLWEKAIDYLEIYIDEEVRSLMEGNQLLIYTNNEKLPFKRIDQQQEHKLRTVFKRLEKDFGTSLTAKDKAYIACKFYNDVEQAIIEKLLLDVIETDTLKLGLVHKLFMRKMRYTLVEGREVSVKELKGLYATYSQPLL